MYFSIHKSYKIYYDDIPRKQRKQQLQAYQIINELTRLFQHGNPSWLNAYMT